MNKYILIVGISAVAGIGWYVWSTGVFTQVPAAPAGIKIEEESAGVSEPEVANEVTVNLQEQNRSGESGTATIVDAQEGVRVVLSLIGAPEGVTQPVHIHRNSCADIGEVLQPLEFLINGSSKTIIPSLQAIIERVGLPLSINVHKSVEEASVYVACGDIVL